MNNDFLSSVVAKMEETKAGFENLSKDQIADNALIKIDPNVIGNWEYRDRQSFEMGDIVELANSIKNKGQAQPIVVVKADEWFKTADNSSCEYIVIAGYRRWLACKSLDLKIEAVVRKLSFEQAVLCLVSENEKEAVSDYSKGMFYKNLLDKEKITKKELYERLGLKRTNFDNYLSFAEVPKEIWDAIGDPRKVSARTSSVIKYFCQKGEIYKQAILSISNQIANGAGEKRITTLVEKKIKEEKGAKDDNATRVALSDKIFLEINKNDLRIKFKNISKNNYDILSEKICKAIESVVNQSNL
ncbi:TPA: ParB/RepB/Spo0J family partition protein [Legionella pneumophila]|nr:ParB/RepB/Spo0J family partition protein [Legionella pneumophila]HAU2065896.1 ParB/RepB/Spo0J family partition protein [Legionella pneumophila]HDZ4879505.1 ParB/RepB/Spo0J family partition protein [Legionella pneumophila]